MSFFNLNSSFLKLSSLYYQYPYHLSISSFSWSLPLNSHIIFFSFSLSPSTSFPSYPHRRPPILPPSNSYNPIPPPPCPSCLSTPVIFSSSLSLFSSSSPFSPCISISLKHPSAHVHILHRDDFSVFVGCSRSSPSWRASGGRAGDELPLVLVLRCLGLPGRGPRCV